MTLFLHNTITRKKEPFKPLDENNVRMYVCGPTVYGRAHLGNARSVVVYDVLFRLLRHLYPGHVTYARNITDVDDKINAAARERRISIKQLTDEVTGWFHADIASLNVLPASDNKSNGIMLEPKATDHIPQMVAIIERLIKNGHAYEAKGNVLFAVKTMKNYGQLSGRVQDELEAGARVKVESYKRDPGDFVLWKPANAEDDASSIFPSPWGPGRPGWHIECSAMSLKYLFDGRYAESDPRRYDFDIHGGGSDLMFPHHENEIAQSCGAFDKSKFAHYWVHNGFLTVNGEKMSKSLGNFITVRDLLDKGVKGEVIRYALLSTKYSEPLDWNDKLVEDAKKELDYFYRCLADFNRFNSNTRLYASIEAWAKYTALNFKDDAPTALNDDLNISKFREDLHNFANSANLFQTKNDLNSANTHRFYLKKHGALIGILQQSPEQWFKGESSDDTAIQSQIDARIAAKKAKNWGEADRIRNELKSKGIILEDRPDGSTDWRRE